MRRLAQNSGHSARLLILVIALLAFACFPALAEADSSGIQYEEALPTATGKGANPPHSGPSAQSSNASGTASAPSTSSHLEKETPGSRQQTSASVSGSRTANSSTPHSQRRNGAGVALENHLRAAGKSNGSMQTASGGGSSPLVPILIAIAALAAISIAGVMVRQRRHRHSPGSAVAPKAS